MPCGVTNIPPPKFFSSFPEGSNSKIGSNVLPAQVSAPHRSSTQMFPVLRSMSIALADLSFLPVGSFGWQYSPPADNRMRFSLKLQNRLYHNFFIV
jgi:hypothetical protein